MAREDGIVYRTAAEVEREAYAIAATVVDDEVLPVVQVVTGIRQLAVECEVVVGPMQTLTPTERQTIHAQVLVGVVVRLVVVIVVVVVAIAITIQTVVVVVHHRCVVEVVVQSRRQREEGVHRE